MKNTLFVIITTFCLLSCKQSAVELKEIKANQIKTDSLITNNDSISQFIAQYRDYLNKQLDSVLTVTSADLTKNDGELESSLGNLMADISFEQAQAIFNKRYEKHIDFVLLNHGGIRAPIPKGNVTSRNAFEVMPFENELVVVELTPEKIDDLLNYLAKTKKAHPISNLELRIARDKDEVQHVSINAEAFYEKNYFVLTTDYLQQGGDKMTFFANPVNLYKTDYKLRNAMIDYFKNTDSLAVKLDKRFTYGN